MCAKDPHKGCYKYDGSAAEGTMWPLIDTSLGIFVFINVELCWQQHCLKT